MTTPSPAPTGRSPAERHIARSAAALESRDWESARRHANLAGTQFAADADDRGLFRAATVLEKLGDDVGAARLLAIAGRLRVPGRLPEWRGEDVSGRTLLVVQRIRDIGAPIRQARAIDRIAGHAGRCIVLASRRLVPILARSFPAADVRCDAEDPDAAWTESDVVASYETLVGHGYPDEAALVDSFRPLCADPGQVQGLVATLGPRRPRVGLSWFSTNRAKDVPPLAAWAGLMQGIDATFVSLQYGDTLADRAAMHAASGRELVHDDGVDQLQDMDRYAAQVAAMDVVVTISNTLAHLAGALGVRTIVILDDKLHLSWPAQGDRCGWYPRTVLLHRQGREWPEVFARIRALLQREFA